MYQVVQDDALCRQEGDVVQRLAADVARTVRLVGFLVARDDRIKCLHQRSDHTDFVELSGDHGFSRP